MKRVTVLGSTGSVGESTLDLVRRNPDGFRIVGLSANTNAESLSAQALEFGAEAVAVADEAALPELRERLNGSNVHVFAGEDGLLELASVPTDFTMAAIVGAAGLAPTLRAVEQGIHVGLANKECLVCAGELFMEAVRANGATLLPVDSEHNAIFQVLETDAPKAVRRIILTASGGPFREKSLAFMQSATREDALDHPVWSMGAKISIDSATLMNKGLELVEAAHLFARPSSEIDVVVHPQSIIHSMVEYVDGSVLAQLGSPDMRTPIAYALAWPARMEAPVERLDFTRLSKLTFEAPDMDRFPALRLARESLEAEGQATNVLNAANEVAVAAFLDGRLRFTQIAETVEGTLDAHARDIGFCHGFGSVDDVLACDRAARKTAEGLVATLP